MTPRMKFSIQAILLLIFLSVPFALVAQDRSLLQESYGQLERSIIPVLNHYYLKNSMLSAELVRLQEEIKLLKQQANGCEEKKKEEKDDRKVD